MRGRWAEAACRSPMTVYVCSFSYSGNIEQGKEKNGLSLPFQSSLSATFTDSTTIFTFIASLSSIQAHTPQMSVT